MRLRKNTIYAVLPLLVTKKTPQNNGIYPIYGISGTIDYTNNYNAENNV